MDAERFAAVLEGFLSPTEGVRKEAEQIFKALKQNSPDEAATLLMQVLRTDPNQARRQQAAIASRNLLRELTHGNFEESVWPRLQPATQHALKTEMVQAALTEQSEVVQRAVGDFLTDVGQVLMQRKEWPELPEVVFKMLRSDSVNVQVLGFNVFGDLTHVFSDLIRAHIEEVAALIESKLNTSNNKVSVAAIGLLFQIVCNETRATWQPFANFLPKIAGVMTALANDEVTGNDCESLMDLLKRMCEIAESTPEFFKKHLGEVAKVSLETCRNKGLSEDTRQICAEFVLLLVDQKPKLCARTENFLKDCVQTLMDFMLDIEEEQAWKERELTCEDDDESRLYDTGEVGLDRLARSVGGDVVIDIVFNKIGEFLQQPDWKHKVAGIVAISQTVEYFPEEKVESQLEQVVDLLLSQTTHEHYRVRFAACRGLGQVALDHQPFVQEQFHDKVLPGLIAAMDDPIARVQSQAFAAFVNFAEEVDIEDLIPYVSGVMDKILLRMNLNFSMPEDRNSTPQAVVRQHRSIREQSITSVAVIAGVLAEQFMPYCEQIVRLMKVIVDECTGADDRQLRGRALECLSIIAFSVGRAALPNECSLIVTALIALYEQDLQIDDPMHDYVHEALRRMVKVLGADFSPFVHRVLTKMLPIFTIEEEKMDGDSNTEDYSLICTTTGEISGVKTSRIEMIDLELQMLLVIVQNCGGAFVPHVWPTMEVVITLLDLKYSDAIRQRSLNVVAELIAAAKAGNAPANVIQQRVLFVIETVFKTVTDEEEIAFAGVTHLTASVSGLARCLDGAADCPMDDAHVRLVCEKVFELISQSFERRNELEESKKDPEADEEDVERVHEESECEQIFRETCLRVLESIIKHHDAQFLSVGADFALQFVNRYITANNHAEDRSLAVFICCDMLEKLGARAIDHLASVLDQVVAYTQDADPSVRQAACFAVTLCMTIPGMNSKFVGECFQKLVQIVKHENAFSKENRNASENAISALVNMVTEQSALLGEELQPLADLVISKLPLTSDDEEATKVHKKLCAQLIQSPTSPFWGTNVANVPQLIKIFGAIYKTHLSDDTTDGLIRQIISRIDIAKLPAIVSQLQISASERRGLKKIERDFAAGKTN